MGEILEKIEWTLEGQAIIDEQMFQTVILMK
jgi:hypothetical protein